MRSLCLRYGRQRKVPKHSGHKVLGSGSQQRSGSVRAMAGVAIERIPVAGASTWRRRIASNRNVEARDVKARSRINERGAYRRRDMWRAIDSSSSPSSVLDSESPSLSAELSWLPDEAVCGSGGGIRAAPADEHSNTCASTARAKASGCRVSVASISS